VIFLLSINFAAYWKPLNNLADFCKFSRTLIVAVVCMLDVSKNVSNHKQTGSRS